MSDQHTVEQVARVIHAANRVLQQIQGDPRPSRPWDECDPVMRANAIAGVEHARDSACGAEESHERWRSHLSSQGWTYGQVKDTAARTHPCLLPWSALPDCQQVKDRMFVAMVAALMPAADRERVL